MYRSPLYTWFIDKRTDLFIDITVWNPVSDYHNVSWSQRRIFPLFFTNGAVSYLSLCLHVVIAHRFAPNYFSVVSCIIIKVILCLLL